MILIANENGDWWEAPEGAQLYVLDTDSLRAKWLEAEGYGSLDELLEGGKAARFIESYGEAVEFPNL